MVRHLQTKLLRHLLDVDLVFVDVRHPTIPDHTLEQCVFQTQHLLQVVGVLFGETVLRVTVLREVGDLLAREVLVAHVAGSANRRNPQTCEHHWRSQDRAQCAQDTHASGTNPAQDRASASQTTVGHPHGGGCQAGVQQRFAVISL